MILAGPLRFPGRLQAWLEQAARAQLEGAGAYGIDFAAPAGAPALVAPDSVAWQVFRNPVSLLVGGIAAVILELAEPRVRSGVWDHTSFRRDPLARLRRTGLAAMVTVYGSRGAAEAMIAGVRRRHAQVRGFTPSGAAYRASDPQLLRWVQATAAFGFLRAYEAYVRPLSAAERDGYYEEGVPAAELYGATGVPRTDAEFHALLADTLPSLESSETVFEFLAIMGRIDLLPRPLRPLQDALVRAAVAIIPAPVRQRLALDSRYDLRRLEAAAIRHAGAVADRLFLGSSPPVQACLRLGLPPDYLHLRQADAAGPGSGPLPLTPPRGGVSRAR